MIRDAEIYTVGTNEVALTFTSQSADEIVTSVGDRQATSTGPFHYVAVAGLEPATTYTCRIGEAAANDNDALEFTTLDPPAGELLSRFATVNDVHFGEQICGLIGGDSEVGPVFTTPPGEPAYPNFMNAAVIADIQGAGVETLLVKGDLTSAGSQQQYDEFLNAYGVFGDGLHHIRGNHESYNSDVVAAVGSKVVELPGLTAVLIDTAEFQRVNGHLSRSELAWIDEVVTASSRPVLLFGHHQLWDPSSEERNENTFGVVPGASEALIELIGRHQHVGGYFAGHTHRNRVRHFVGARNVPIVEVASTKEYPGAWAEYRIYEGGYVQIGWRASRPDALAWAERTRGLYAGLYREYALGSLADRCFTQPW